jgi:UDP-glucose 4-epimerase
MILIVGGAGYIGSHTARLFKDMGYEVLIFDNFLNSSEEVCKILEIPYVKGDIRNVVDLKVLDKYNLDGCLHFAGYLSVATSMTDPSLYFNNNFVGSINLFDKLISKGTKNIVFSSTSEVYGEAQYLPINEAHPLNPVNPYGLSKLMVENMLSWYNKAYGVNYAALRYFNAAGCSTDSLIGENHEPEPHLIPNAVMGGMKIKDFELTCSVVETPDKTPIRDYIHVEDLADAHLKAYEYITKEGKSGVFNLGTGKGNSVLEIVEAVEKFTGNRLVRKEGVKREGEPAQKYADFKKAKETFGWEPKRDLDDMVKSTYEYFKKVRFLK